MKTPLRAILPVMFPPLSLVTGMKMLEGTDEFILRGIDEKGVLLQHTRTNEFRRADEAMLTRAIHEGIVKLEGYELRKLPLQVTETAVAEAGSRGATARALRIWEAKIAWLNALRERGIHRIVDEPWVRSEIARLAESDLKGVQRFKASTLYVADLEVRKAKGDLAAIVPEYNLRGGAGQSRLDPDVYNAMRTQIELVRDGEGRIVKHDIHLAVIDRVNDLNLTRPNDLLAPPSESTTLREIGKRISAYVITERNRGSKHAKDLYRSNSQSRDTAERINEVCEYDDVDTAVYCVDERSGLAWGRVQATHGVDQYSRLVCGYDLSDKPRDFNSALGAICDSLLPKDGLQPGQMGYGVQGRMLLDNARYNDSQATLKQTAALNLLLSPCRPYGPTEKNGNEFFNGVLKRDFSPRVAGWAGVKGDREAIREGVAAAVCDISEFRREHRHWIVNVYPNLLGEDGYTAKQRWNRFLSQGTPAVRYTREQLGLIRLRPLNTQLTFRASGGLLRLRLRYDCLELDELRRRLGHDAKVDPFYDAQDLSYIGVLNPFTRKLIRVPCTEQADHIAHLNEYQQKLILKMCRQRGIKNPSIKEQIEARVELEKLTAQAAISNKLRKRNWARLAQGAGGSGASPNSGAQHERSGGDEGLVTELESEMNVLESIELEAEDRF